MLMVSKNEARQIAAKCPDLGFVSTRHHIYMEERKDAKTALNILRNSNIKSWKRARITACVIMLLALLLTACGRQTMTLYTDDAISVTRQGAQTRIVDLATSEAYTFTTRRIRKPQTAEEAARWAVCKTTADTDTLTVMTVRNEIVIVEKTTGKTVCIR